MSLNSHWQMVDRGSRVIINTPEQMWEAAKDYFKWCDDNPLKAKRTLTSGKTQGDKVEVEFVRPYTIKGFCLHANISEAYLNDIGNSTNKSSEEYLVLERILYVIHTQNVEGAVVDMYNPLMVTKLLNMDKGENDQPQTVKIEIVQSESRQLATSENEILKNLDFGKADLEKEKDENFER